MARRPGRYLEGRLYMAWAAAALLLATWLGTVADDNSKDRMGQAADGAQTVQSAATSDSQVHTKTRGS